MREYVHCGFFLFSLFVTFIHIVMRMVVCCFFVDSSVPLYGNAILGLSVPPLVGTVLEFLVPAHLDAGNAVLSEVEAGGGTRAQPCSRGWRGPTATLHSSIT